MSVATAAELAVELSRTAASRAPSIELTFKAMAREATDLLAGSSAAMKYPGPACIGT